MLINRKTVFAWLFFMLAIFSLSQKGFSEQRGVKELGKGITVYSIKSEVFTDFIKKPSLEILHKEDSNVNIRYITAGVTLGTYIFCQLFKNVT